MFSTLKERLLLLKYKTLDYWDEKEIKFLDDNKGSNINVLSKNSNILSIILIFICFLPKQT